MKHIPGLVARIVIMGAAIVAILGAAVSAKTFVSYNGKFHITYPDNWDQIDYRSVDYYVTMGNPNPELLNYEAVFAPAADQKFFEGPYLLLTVDTVGEQIGRVKDSTIAQIAKGFLGKLDSTFSGDMFAQLRPDTPMYDPSTRLLAVLTNLHEGRTLVKRNLLVVRLYQQGLANFYFYAPDSVWQNSLPIFAQIARSFTPGTPAKSGAESVKIADIKPEEKSSSAPRSIWIVPPALVVILIAIIATRRRRKKTAGQ